MLFRTTQKSALLRASILNVIVMGLAGCASHQIENGPVSDNNQTVEATPSVSTTWTSNYSNVYGQDGQVDTTAARQLSKPKSYILGGSGTFLNTAPGSEDNTKRISSETVTLNFLDIPIADAVNAILGDILGRRYVIEEGVTGTMTLRSSRPIAKTDLLPILESVLKSKGAAIVEEGQYLRIIPSVTASRQGRVSSGQSILGYGVHVEPLQYIAAPEMARILEPIAPEGSILRVDRSRNMLLLAGTQSEISALVDTIATFDVDWLAGMSFGVYPLQSGSPEDLIGDIEDVFSSRAESPIEGLVRFLPNSRLNAVVAITPTPSILRHVETWIDKFDDIGEQKSEQLFVYDVQNGTAAELAQVLQSVLGGQTTSQSRPQTVAPGLRARSASSSDVDGTSEQDRTSRSSGSSFQNASGFEIGNSSPLVSGDAISVFPYDSKNSLVIVATPADYQGLLAILEKLDVVSNQVLLEATIAEVTLRDELSLGLQWFFQDAENQVTLSSASNGGVGSVFPGFSYIFSQADARVALNALSSITDVNVISSPSVMVLDNQTAVLQVGDEVPVVTQQSVTNSINTPLFNSISFRDTGVILSVTPRVNDSGLVLLEIEQEVSSVVETITSGIDSPTIQQRRIDTTVAVHDGESLALGGLIEDGVTRTESGVPFISQVPVLGNLFKSESDRDERTELLIIITPRVIRNMDEARRVTDEYRRRLNTLQSLDQRLDGRN